MLKKKHFRDYLKKKETSKEDTVPEFNLHALGEKMEFMEMDLEAEMAKMREKKNKGVKPCNIERISNQEISHMKKVINHE